jgi:hypothetical protein
MVHLASRTPGQSYIHMRPAKEQGPLRHGYSLGERCVETERMVQSSFLLSDVALRHTMFKIFTSPRSSSQDGPISYHSLL